MDSQPTLGFPQQAMQRTGELQPMNEAVESDVSIETQNQDYQRVAQALAYLDAHYVDQPSLQEISDVVGLSTYHFQRLFTRWAGISPKKFMQHLTLDRAKQSLRDNASVLDATFDAGLSGPGRLHDLFVTSEAVTPGEYKTKGRGLTIRYGYHPTPFGECLLLTTDRGICGLGFVIDEDRQDALDHLTKNWSGAEIIQDDAVTGELVGRIFSASTSPRGAEATPLRVLLNGTEFQVKVWNALLSVPPGSLTTYEDIARRIGYKTNASRAIGLANGANLISYLVPCHRVIRKSGAIGGYRWGRERKLALIGWEASQAA